MTPIWKDIQCPNCPEPFDERSWNDRHSIGFDEIHSQCCTGCDGDGEHADWWDEADDAACE